MTATVLHVANPIEIVHVIAPGSVVRSGLAAVGMSVHRFLKRNRWRFDLDTILVVNGRPVLRRDDGWRTFRFKPGDVVRFISKPFGGNTGKQIGGLVALIVLTALAFQFVGPLLTPLVGSAMAAAGNAFFVAAGMLAYNMLVYPQGGNKSDDNNLYSFNASGNVARPLETIPDPYGRLQRDLNYAALPYKTYDGDTEYMQGLFMVGLGTYEHEALLVEDNEFWTAEAAAADGTGTGEGGTVPAGSTAWIGNTSGSRANSPGVIEPWDGVQVEFIPPGATVTLFPTNIHQSPDATGIEFDHPFLGSSGSTPKPGGGWSPWFTVCNPEDKTTKVNLDILFPSGLSANAHATYVEFDVQTQMIDALGDPLAPETNRHFRFDGFNKKPFRKTYQFGLAEARYQMRFRKTIRPWTDAGTDTMVCAGIRAELTGEETVFEHGTMVAVRIKATKQLSPYSEKKIRYRGTRVLPVWTGEGFENQPTRNPIWAALDLRCNTTYGGKWPLAKVQLDDVIAAAEAADTRGDTFDYEFSSAVKVGEAVDTALFSARSKHRWLGQYFSLVRDEWQTTPRMVITDREMVRGSFALNAAFRPANGPDGLVMNYVDGQTWQKKKVTIPVGSSPLNPLTVEGKGITDRLHATREATFIWNAAVKRRVTPTFTMDMQGHMLAYGDHVGLSSESPQSWGQAYGVVGLSGSTVRLPKAASWPEATMYALISDRFGRPFGPCRVTQGSSPRQVVFNADDLAAVVTATGQTLAEALSREPDADPPTIALGEAFDFLRRAQITGAEIDGDTIRLSAFLDYEDVHGEVTVADPDAPQLPPPGYVSPRVTGVSASLQQVLFETRLLASWPQAPNATSYLAEISYDEGATWLKVYQGEPASFDVVVDNDDMLLRIFPIGDRGVGIVSPSYAIAKVEGITIPPGVVTLPTFGADAVSLFSNEIGHLLGLAAEFVVREQATDEQKVAFGNAMSAITTTRQLLASGDTALADLITAVTASLNSAFASSSIRFTSVVAPGGIAARIALEVKAGSMSSWGASGLYIDVVETGIGTGIFVGKITLRADYISFQNGAGDDVLYWDNANLRMVFKGGEVLAGKVTSVDGKAVLDLDDKFLEFWD
jgi:hypothetical protein